MTSIIRSASYALMFLPMLTFASLAQEGSDIRNLPYPFSHVETFSSDIDSQLPWHGAAIHRVLNYELGLTLSDSIWPLGSEGTSSLFSGPSTLNRTPSGVDGLPTFALLLRQWHRGGFDQFHGWIEDGTPRVKNEFNPPIGLSGRRSRVEIPKLKAPADSYRSSQLRLYFDREPPYDMSVIARDFAGAAYIFDSVAVQVGREVQKLSGPSEYIVELQSPAGTSVAAGVLHLQALASLEIIAPSCQQGCQVHLTRLERDGFSRLVASRQAKFLEQTNIRPALYTTHGGYTIASGFGTGKFLNILSPAFKEMNVFGDAAAVASVATSHAYLVDILFRLGVVGVTPYEETYSRPTDETIPFIGRSTRFDDLYNVRRTQLPALAIESKDKFLDNVSSAFPGINRELAAETYCGPACFWSQGDAMGQQLLVAEHLRDHRPQTTFMWYIHFGSGGSTFKPDIREPIAPNVMFWLRRLAGHVYGFDRSTGDESRVWVPPASTWLRYLVTMEGLKDHLNVSEAGDIKIESWWDSVIRRRVPEVRAGTRDLHGVTIYVPNAKQPKISLDGLPIKTFTRNPPDRTGRPSITVVDDNAPTVIMDEVPLEMRGRVTISAGDFRDVAKAATPAASGERFASIVADTSGRADVLFEPADLKLFNSSHVHFAYRKAGADSTAALRLDLIMEDGGVVSAAELNNASPSFSSYWTLLDEPPSGDWREVTLATDQLAWPKSVVSSRGARPPLPLGKVAAVRVSVTNAKPNEVVDLDDIAVLRPSGAGIAPDGKLLVSGRVTDVDRIPLQGVAVNYEDDDGASVSTTTDSDGIYIFPLVGKGSRLRLHTMFDGRPCPPNQGAMIDVRKNEAEVDFDLSRCTSG